MAETPSPPTSRPSCGLAPLSNRVPRDRPGMLASHGRPETLRHTSPVAIWLKSSGSCSRRRANFSDPTDEFSDETECRLACARASMRSGGRFARGRSVPPGRLRHTCAGATLPTGALAMASTMPRRGRTSPSQSFKPRTDNRADQQPKSRGQQDDQCHPADSPPMHRPRPRRAEIVGRAFPVVARAAQPEIPCTAVSPLATIAAFEGRPMRRHCDGV